MKLDVFVDGAFCDQTGLAAIAYRIRDRITAEVFDEHVCVASTCGYDIHTSVQTEFAAALCGVDQTPDNSFVYLHTDCVAVCKALLEPNASGKDRHQKDMGNELRWSAQERQIILMPIWTNENDHPLQRECHVAALAYLRQLREDLYGSQSHQTATYVGR